RRSGFHAAFRIAADIAADGGRRLAGGSGPAWSWQTASSSVSVQQLRLRTARTAAGRPRRPHYSELLKEQITGPLGLSDTVVSLSPGQQSQFIQGYEQVRAGLRPGVRRNASSGPPSSAE